MNLKEISKKFFERIGLSAAPMKDGKVDLTTEQKANLEALFGTDAVAKIINAIENEANAKQKADEDEKEALKRQIQELELTNTILESEPITEESVIPQKVKNTTPTPKHSATHLYGIQREEYKSSKWYNRLFSHQEVKERTTQAEKDEFRADFDKFTTELSERWKTRQREGMMAAAGDMDFTTLSTQLGDYYYQRRQDELIDYIRTLPSVEGIFPVMYNVQDGTVLVDAFEGKSYSQAHQSGEIAAGSMKFAANIARVSDVMFKYLFKDLKNLEKQYIGYLNREGSNPMKWTFIEWVVKKSAEIISNEKNQRRVVGVRVEPTTDKPSYFSYASDGVLTTLDRFKEENRVYVFNDKNTYTKSTIIDYFGAMVDNVLTMLGTGSLVGWAVYFNANHIRMYLEAHREAYGTDADYVGERLEIKNSDGIKLIGVPNMGKRYDVFITEEKNFECYENIPGEAFNMYFEQRLEQLWAVSWFKEGTGAMKPGRAYADAASVLAAEGRHTMIFANAPYTALAADATTAVATANRYFRTIANSGATAITDITGATQGILYKIECGSTTNATTIAKAGKFSTLTAAWTPTAVGDYIEVIYDPTGSKFYEYARKVGGTYAKNTALVAPEYTEAI